MVNVRESFGHSMYKINQNIMEREVDLELLQEKIVTINDRVHKYYYLPIEPVIKQILSNKLAMEYIMKFHRGKELKIQMSLIK